MALSQAAEEAMTDLRDLGGDYIGGMNLIALDKDGGHIGMSSRSGGSYIYQTEEMDNFVKANRQVVVIEERWDGEKRN